MRVAGWLALLWRFVSGRRCDLSQKPIIAVVGSVNMDLVITTPRVPVLGENLLAHDLSVGLGGKGANPAVALSRMGAEPLLVGCLGDDDFGRQALEALRDEGVGTDAIVVQPGVSTGVAMIMVNDVGENTILVIIGANEQLTPDVVQRSLGDFRGRLGALMVNFEIPEECVAAAVREGRAQGIPVVVDAGPPRHYARDTWREATIVSPNALEAATLVGYDVEDDAQSLKAARELLAAGPEAIVLKRGVRGALICTREQETYVPGFDVPVVDTTGAGDAFTAGLTLGIAEGKPLEAAVRFANAAGALAVTRLGTMRAMPRRAEVEALLLRES